MSLTLTGGHVAVAGDEAGHPRASDEVARHFEIERRQCERLVVDRLNRRSALAEGNDRTKGRIVGNADDEFLRLRPDDHRLDDHAGNAGFGFRRPRAGNDVGRGRPHRRFRGEAEAHPADVRLVDDVRRLDLDDHRSSGAEKRPRGGAGLLGVARQHRRHHRDRIGGQHRRGGDRIEPAAPVAQRLLDRLPRRRGVGHEMLGQARRRRHQRVAGFGIAHNMHEPAHRVGLGRIMGNLRRNERLLDGIVGPDPDREHRLRLDDRTAMLRERPRRPWSPLPVSRRAPSAR